MYSKVNDDTCYKLHYLSRLVMIQLNSELRPHGVTQGQLPVLCCLSDKEGQTQAELCGQISVEQPTMANTLQRMERDGLIYRVPCEKDKRQSRIFLTDKSRPIVNTLLEKRDEVLSHMTISMTRKEVGEFHRLLDVAIEALDARE